MSKKRSKKRREERVYCRYIKRMLDILLSGILLLFLMLPILIICVIIRLDSSGAAIFKQVRLGRRGVPFVCYKFRTMYIYAPTNMSATFEGRYRYITRVGKFLRRSSLDEIPQLFNVFKGDMSLVGPRPLISDEKKVHEGRMSKGVYSLRPGITGMAQISGRNLIGDEEKLKKDTYYLKNVKIWLDMKIILKTIAKVFKGEGIDKEEVNR